MDPYAPYMGALLMPDRVPLGTSSPVTFGDGSLAASIRWARIAPRGRFHILDSDEQTELASGGGVGISGRHFRVSRATGEEILDLKTSVLRISGKSTARLSGGRTFSIRGDWRAREFTVTDVSGQQVARLTNDRQYLSGHLDNLAVQLPVVVLSVVEAVSLAQCLRAAIKLRRRRRRT